MNWSLNYNIYIYIYIYIYTESTKTIKTNLLFHVYQQKYTNYPKRLQNKYLNKKLRVLNQYLPEIKLCHHVDNARETCNFTVSNTSPWVFLTYLKLYKWYNIAQRTTHYEEELL